MNNPISNFITITETKDIQVNKTPVQGRIVLKVLALLSFICFFMPLSTISCNGQTRRINGFNAAFGFKFQGESVSGNFAFILMLFIPVAIFALAYLKKMYEFKYTNLIIAGCALLGLIILGNYRSEVIKRTLQNFASASFDFAFQLNVFVNFLILVVSVFMFVYIYILKPNEVSNAAAPDSNGNEPSPEAVDAISMAAQSNAINEAMASTVTNIEAGASAVTQPSPIDTSEGNIDDIAASMDTIEPSVEYAEVDTQDTTLTVDASDTTEEYAEASVDDTEINVVTAEINVEDIGSGSDDVISPVQDSIDTTQPE